MLLFFTLTSSLQEEWIPSDATSLTRRRRRRKAAARERKRAICFAAAAAASTPAPRATAGKWVRARRLKACVRGVGGRADSQVQPGRDKPALAGHVSRHEDPDTGTQIFARPISANRNRKWLERSTERRNAVATPTSPTNIRTGQLTEKCCFS